MFLNRKIAEELVDDILDRMNVYKKSVKNLQDREIEGYVIQTDTLNHMVVKIKDMDVREYELEETCYPDVMCEELMYDVLEGIFLDKNLEVVNLQPMRWQDYYRERIEKLEATCKTMQEYIENHKE